MTGSIYPFGRHLFPDGVGAPCAGEHCAYCNCGYDEFDPRFPRQEPGAATPVRVRGER